MFDPLTEEEEEEMKILDPWHQRFNGVSGHGAQTDSDGNIFLLQLLNEGALSLSFLIVVLRPWSH